MFFDYSNKQRRMIMWCGALLLALTLVPAGAQAATILAAISVNGEKLQCESPFTSIAGEDVVGQALVLGLDLNYEVPVEDGRATGRVAASLIGIRKDLDACTPLILQVLVQQRVVQVTLTIFDKNPSDGSDRAKTRITLDNARIAGVQAKGTPSDSASSMTTTQELVKVAPERVTVDDLVAGTSFQFDLLAQR